MKNRRIRQSILEKDLIEYNPAHWRLNIPGRSFSIRVEDLVPALSGAIGKVSLVAAFAMAWAAGLGITDPAFVTENVRLEIIVASLFALLFSALLIPVAGPPGTLAPLIPMIPSMVSAGVHPLSFNLLTGLIAIVFAHKGYFARIAALNRSGTKAGILLLFGVMGIISSYQKMQAWAGENSSLFLLLIAVGGAAYVVLGKLNAKWLVIPVCGVLAILVSALHGHYPSFETGPGLPMIFPSYWWNERWGIGFGFSAGQIIAAVPFALMVVTMWPIDALTSKTLQEANYPAEAKMAVINLDATFIVVGLRNIVGAMLGGSQTAAVWRSFMIPLAVVKRPIGGSAFFLALFGLAFGFLGFPIDVSVFPALVWLVLIFGVFAPMAEAGLSLIRNAAAGQIALLCVIIGLSTNPMLGWSAALFAENLFFVKRDVDNPTLKKDIILSAALLFIAIVSYVSVL